MASVQEMIQEAVERTMGAMQLRIISLETELALTRQMLDATGEVPDDDPEGSPDKMDDASAGQ